MAQAQPQTWTVRRILEWTSSFFDRKEVDSARLSAELLLAHVLKLPRIKLYTDHDRPLIEQELTAYRELVRRAGEHEPIAYLTGKAHFFDLELEIKPGVLIPRPDTETLVETALNVVRHMPGWEGPRILDLCTGSGCIAAALAKHLKLAHLIAVDISPVAIEVAKRNFELLKLTERISLVQGDLYSALSQAVDPSPFHLIVSNPPYIRTKDIAGLDRSVKEFEPHLALDGGADGLDIHRRILEEAADRLLPAGRVMMEIAYDQAEAALEMARGYPRFTNARVVRDAAGNNRVLTMELGA